MARLACLAVVAVFLLSGTNQVLSQSQDNIRFQNNRYSGILVAISDTLSYDPQIVGKIKVYSSYMFILIYMLYMDRSQ